MTHAKPTFDAALRIAQQAVTVLVRWANAELPNECRFPDDCDATEHAKKILNWCDRSLLQQPPNNILQPLRLLFDSVKLERGQQQVHYWQAQAIANSHPRIPYPQPEKSTSAELENFKLQIRDEISQLQLKQKDWENLNLLMLILEKFGSHISFGQSDDIALVDLVRSTAAIAAILANNPNLNQLSLISGDISGIQKFIYTISSDGALKSLRARSFYLELVTEEVVQQLLCELNLPHTNIIYAGGGNLYLLASNDPKQVQDAVDSLSKRFNKWLSNTFQGKLFLALDYSDFPIEAVKTPKFADYWTEVTKKLAKQKSRKFASELNNIIKPCTSYEPCRVCHRDDLPSIKPLIRLNSDSSLACWMCRTMFELGDRLFEVKAVLRSNRANIKSSVDRICIGKSYYYFFLQSNQAVTIANDNEVVFIINDWELQHYLYKHTIPLLLGNYAQSSEEKIESQKEPGFIRAGEMATKKARGISRVGYLRMDVDRLGRIFAEGLDDQKNLPRIAGLSRQISYFFKVYLNSLAAFRKQNIPNDIKQLTPENERLNLLFIYAGGDDLFVSGAWNEIVEFAFDVYQCFRAYTGQNPDITLSGGISIADAKFPLYQAADESKKAEEAAKGNDRDSLGLFGQVLKWDEWLGTCKFTSFDEENKKYQNPEAMPNLLGVMPFVEILDNQDIDINHSRSFVRNLLITAQIQEQALNKIKNDKFNNPIDTRYYLHLPKIAYTLARLPNRVLDNADFRTSLKSPYNAPYFRAIATWIELLNR